MGSARTAGVFLGAVFAFAAVESPAALAQDSIGRTRVVVQTVTGETGAVRRKLAVRDDVFSDELIRTELDSASVIRFVDKTRLTLGPNARLTLDEAVFDPTPGRGAFVLSAVQGVFRFLSGDLDSSAYEITTPTVSIGVRGTMFAGVVAPDGTTVVILQSPDEVTVRHRTSGDRVTLSSHSDSTTAYPDGVLTEPGPAPGWARAMLQQMDDLLRIDPIHIERDNLEDESAVIEASAAPAAPLTIQTPENDEVSEPTPIVAPTKVPPPPEPRKPPVTAGKARALERAGIVAAGPAQTGGLARAKVRADVRAEGSGLHGNGGRDGSHDSGAQGGRSETAAASSDSGQAQSGSSDAGGGQGSNSNEHAATSSGGKSGSGSGGNKGGKDRGEQHDKGGGKGSGGKGKKGR